MGGNPSVTTGASTGGGGGWGGYYGRSGGAGGKGAGGGIMIYCASNWINPSGAILIDVLESDRQWLPDAGIR